MQQVLNKTPLRTIVLLAALWCIIATLGHAQLIGGGLPGSAAPKKPGPQQAPSSEKEARPEFTPKTASFVIGFHAHTYGLGIDLAYRRQLWPKYDLVVHSGIASFKNPEEFLVSPSVNLSFIGPSDYIFRKINYTYFVDFTPGIQRTLISRSQFHRVQLKAGLGIGPVMAVLKPYVLDVIEGNAIVARQYNPNITAGNIVGESDFFQAFPQITTQWGVRMRADFFVDFSGNSWFVRGLNAGFQYDVFGKDVPTMVLVPNMRQYFGWHVGLVIGNAW